MLLFLLYLLLPVLAQSCLVIRYTEPPKCECQWIPLNRENIESFAGENPFYTENVTVYKNYQLYSLLFPPVSTQDDCSLSIYCDIEGLSLVVMTKTFAILFGAYSADALCNPYTQKWQVDNGAELVTYDELYAVCLDYRLRTTVTPPPATPELPAPTTGTPPPEIIPFRSAVNKFLSWFW
ncbi:hypothetical protein GCK72_021914 [Caenorhabditis remanei]|uniref:Uncharacterized protein n=1 Tax=Caenorhabditis remanei TaxID=31234 RepID=A0A6A5GLD8_CAERE|nr:hypothetical protein GCK72_021914 [Caenorhabditis remanei]KAF1755345.1 hypothetical protein GCK72_021914 [Caenorhabditis remanei]